MSEVSEMLIKHGREILVRTPFLNNKEELIGEAIFCKPSPYKDINARPPNHWIYARVSNKKQSSGDSLVRQILFSINADCFIWKIGNSLEKRRPGLEFLLNSCGRHDKISVYKLDRLTRDLAHAIELMREFVNIAVIFDTSTFILGICTDIVEERGTFAMFFS